MVYNAYTSLWLLGMQKIFSTVALRMDEIWNTGVSSGFACRVFVAVRFLVHNAVAPFQYCFVLTSCLAHSANSMNSNRDKKGPHDYHLFGYSKCVQQHIHIFMDVLSHDMNKDTMIIRRNFVRAPVSIRTFFP